MMDPATLFDTNNLIADECFSGDPYCQDPSSGTTGGVMLFGNSGAGPFASPADDVFPKLVGVEELPVVADAECGGDADFGGVFLESRSK